MLLAHKLLFYEVLKPVITEGKKDQVQKEQDYGEIMTYEQMLLDPVVWMIQIYFLQF